MTLGALLPNVTAVAIGGRALLIEGPPGFGKSTLALALIDRGAVLIGDDGVTLEMRGGVLWIAPPPNTGGMIEVRNVGIVELPTTCAPASLVLKLDPAAPRFPLEIPNMQLAGALIPLLDFRPGDAAQALRAEYALDKHGLAFADRGARADTAAP